MVSFFQTKAQTQCITRTTKGCTCTDRYPSPTYIDTRGLVPIRLMRGQGFKVYTYTQCKGSPHVDSTTSICLCRVRAPDHWCNILILFSTVCNNRLLTLPVPVTSRTVVNSVITPHHKYCN